MRLGDAATLVDHIRDPFRVFVLRGARGAVCDPDTAVGVAEQREGEVELLREMGVVGNVVETGAEDGRVFLLLLTD